jgi:mannose-6-phosphate isomerase-like protein (cupin superfamily)
MSYPDPRYFGDTGQINAVFRPAHAEPDFVSKPVNTAGPTVGDGTAYHYLATTASTAGEFGLYRIDMGPEPAGPSTHFHKTMSESFFILSGTMRLFDGDRWIDAHAGDFLYVPVAGCTPSATSRANPRPCCCCSHRARPGRPTSKESPSSRTSVTRNGRSSSSVTTTTSSNAAAGSIRVPRQGIARPCRPRPGSRRAGPVPADRSAAPAHLLAFVRVDVPGLPRVA